MKILLVVGTRPQIIKSAPIITQVIADPEIELEIIHTGQHYDYDMSEIFFDELKVSECVKNLNIGSGNHGWQTGSMLIGIEKVMRQFHPDCVIVPGDTNSTLAGALAASKMNIKLSHVESGARSFDMKMPEEVNRRLTDHCSDILFTVNKNCENNLLKEGISKEKLFLVGDTMYDLLLNQTVSIEASQILETMNLVENDYTLVTSHRQENVDNLHNLKNIVESLLSLDNITIIFPLHPRTKKNLIQAGLFSQLEKARHIRLLSPLGYHDTLKLVKNARLLMTDSGGMQKEAFWLKTRCITLRNSTEWIETIEAGANVLVGTDKKLIIGEARKILSEETQNIVFQERFFGDGKAAEKIIDVIMHQQ